MPRSIPNWLIIPLLALAAVLRWMQGGTPWWAYPLITAAVFAFGWAGHLREKRRERRLRGTPFISYASRRRL